MNVNVLSIFGQRTLLILIGGKLSSVRVDSGAVCTLSSGADIGSDSPNTRALTHFLKVYLEVVDMQRIDFKYGVLTTFLLVFAFVGSAAGQGLKDVSVSGQVRHRTEYTGKDFDSNRDNVWFHLLRTRINMTANPAEDVKAFVQFQDSRFFGSETNTLTDGSADAMDVHQAFFQVDNVFDSKFSARIGRQEIIVGNERLMGAVGWSNIGRSFDGVRFMHELEKGSLQFFAAKLVGEMDVPDSQNLFGAAGAFPFSDGHDVEVMALYDNNTSEIDGGEADGEHVLSRYTVGAAATGKTNGLDYEVEVYFQGGNKEQSGGFERASISAYLVSGKVGFVVSKKRKVRLGALYTIVSGDDDSSDDEFGAFNTLFATNHKFYGFMDYFVSFGGANGPGLRDLAVSLGVNASDALRLKVDLHHFTADQTPAGVDDVFGQEVDVTGVYRYNSAFSFTIGVSAFVPGDLMKVKRGDDTAFWFYLMTAVNL